MDVGDNSRSSGGMGKPSTVPKSKMTLGKKDKNAFANILGSGMDDPSIGKRSGGMLSGAPAAGAMDPVTLNIEEKVYKEKKSKSYIC